jgi:hypothetical protein
LPRISLYKPEKGNNYRFIDRQISQMFQFGGTDVYVHKYLGPKNPDEGTADQPIYDEIKETNIQDMLFLENRDRKYDQEIYRIRGIYNVQNIDFNLSQFGLFIDNDTLYMTVHINDFIKYVGRKPLSGDVMELPHLKDEFALNDYDISLPRYYVIQDVGRASEGFSATWYPHLYRLKLTKLVDGQQFSDILDKPASDESDMTLRDLLSTHARELEINDAIVQQAEADAPMSGYETRQFYTLSVDKDTGKSLLTTTDTSTIDASSMGTSVLASGQNAVPLRTGYTGYLVGDGYPVNGYVFGHGIQFPANAAADDFFLRTDFMPNRLFKFDGIRWIRIEDAVRMNMTNNDVRQTLKTGFINNSDYIYTNELATDFVSLTEGQYVINTEIDFMETQYVCLKLENTQVITVEVGYSSAENPSLITSYTDSSLSQKVRITLPEINGTQQTIPYSGTWRLRLCDTREAVRQSLSKALRPKADL